MRTLTALALLCSLAHFAVSGIRQPFDHPSLAKFDEHATPLREHLRTGEPVHSRNPAQYGPAFFFVMQPLVRDNPDEWTLATRLYIVQLLCIAGAFAFTCASLRLALPIDRPETWTFLVVWLAIIWLNFSPLYTILAQKSVETWELFLVSLGLYAYLRGWLWAAAIAIAAAGLIKVLPFVFLYYWLVTDRRTFVYAALSTAALLAIAHALYGSEIGAAYLPRILAGSIGDSYGLTWHENISLKAALARLFGYLPQPTEDGARTSGYFLVLTGWRRTATIALGDAAALVALATLTWMWTRRAERRSHPRTLWNWSLLAVLVLILSPNTIFEYATLALGAISFAFAAIVLRRHDRASTATLLFALVLLGGILPRSLLNRLLLIDTLSQRTGHAHLAASEAYQYFGFPLIGLALLAVTIWRLRELRGVD